MNEALFYAENKDVILKDKYTSSAILSFSRIEVFAVIYFLADLNEFDIAIKTKHNSIALPWITCYFRYIKSFWHISYNQPFSEAFFIKKPIGESPLIFFLWWPNGQWHFSFTGRKKSFRENLLVVNKYQFTIAEIRIKKIKWYQFTLAEIRTKRLNLVYVNISIHFCFFFFCIQLI